MSYDVGFDDGFGVLMARNIDEVNITNWNNTGLTTPFPRYTFDIEIKWTNNDGTSGSHGPQTYTFPNDLGSMPLAVRKRFAEEMIISAVRVSVGVDDWDKYI